MLCLHDLQQSGLEYTSSIARARTRVLLSSAPRARAPLPGCDPLHKRLADPPARRNVRAEALRRDTTAVRSAVCRTDAAESGARWLTASEARRNSQSTTQRQLMRILAWRASAHRGLVAHWPA